MSSFIQLLRSKPLEVGFSINHYFFGSLGQSFFLGIFSSYFCQATDLSRLELAGLYALATLTAAFALAFMGQRFSNAGLLKIGPWIAVILPTGLWLATYASTEWQLFLIYVVLRVGGQGLMPLMGSVYVVNILGKQRGKGLSLGALGATLGEFILPPLVTWAILFWDWQTALMYTGFGLALIYLVTRRVLSANAALAVDSTIDNVRPPSSWRLLGRFDFLIKILLYTLPTMVITGFFIHPSIVAEILEVEVNFLTAAMGTYGVVRIISILAGGSFTDRFGAVRVFRIASIPLGIALLMLSFLTGQWMVFAYVLLIGITTSFSGISSAALWAEIYPIEQYGGIKSLAGSCMAVSTAVGTVLIPWLYEGVGGQMMLWMLAGWAGLLVVVNWVVARPQ